MMSRLSFASQCRWLITLWLVAVFVSYTFAQQPEKTEHKVQNPISAAQEQSKSLQRAAPPAVKIVTQSPSPLPAEDMVVDYDRVERQGDVIVYSGNVEARYADMRIFANRVSYNDATKDIIAEGDIYFEQQGQSLVGERAEFNLKTKRGTIFLASGFTNQTPDGSRLVIDAARVDKTDIDTYVLDQAMVTACQERVPKWSFSAKRARIQLDKRATVYNALFRVKNIPLFYLPYASLPITKRDRSSGFLLPTSGSSDIKGRTLHIAYYQTLGRSADILFRSDLYTKRGVGTGFDFRARPDEHSRIAAGAFLVFDRLLGPKKDPAGNDLPNQGGSSFYVDAVQYLKNGFIAVADVNLTSSFSFRQVFAENIHQAISPEEQSLVYLNRNWRSYSFNAAFGEQGTFISTGLVKTRTLPSFELSQRSTRISESFPAYFSIDVALEGMRRTEVQGSGSSFDLKTPSIVQRLDVAPRLTLPLRSVVGFTITPSLALRSTFYSDSLDPIKHQVIGQNLGRNYADLAVDIRPPSLAKIFYRRDGSPWFKHVIEPYFTYRRIAGIDEYDGTLKFDERDVIAETNEIEYGIANRFFARRSGGDGSAPQAHEVLDITLTQKYFFDPTFGGALRENARNQFFPINTLSGFAFGSVRRNLSPLNLRMRYRPNPSVFADVRLNYDTKYHQLRDLIFGGGIARGIFSVSHSWYYTRRVTIDSSQFDPSTLPGNQMDLSAFVGNPTRGPYGGFNLSYDLNNRDFSGALRDRRLINLTTTAGWAWDCCTLQVQNATYNVGLRNENRIFFTFTLKGVGTFGTENFGQRR